MGGLCLITLFFLGISSCWGDALDHQPSPKSPSESLECIRVPSGFKVESVASEPLIESPVAFEWGPDGKLWVVEMRDYPTGGATGDLTQRHHDPQAQRKEATKGNEGNEGLGGKAAQEDSTNPGAEGEGKTPLPNAGPRREGVGKEPPPHPVPLPSHLMRAERGERTDRKSTRLNSS